MRSRSAPAKKPDDAPAQTPEASLPDPAPDVAPEPAMEPRGSMGVEYPLPRPKLGAGYERIVRTVFDMPEPDMMFTRLRDELRLSTQPSRADYGTQVDALDQAERNAQEAVELLVNFQLQLEHYEIDALVISSSLRRRAVDDLEATRTKGGKTITEGDVKARMATMFPDEWRELEGNLIQAKGAVEATRSLADRWKERARDQRVMVQTTRGT